MTVTGRDRHRPNGHHAIQKVGRGGAVLLLAATLFFGGCSGNTNSSGPAAPLPTGQTGSIKATSNPGNCYISDTAACSSTSPEGTYSITALATLEGTSNYLYLGDSDGNIEYATVTSTSTAPPPRICPEAARPRRGVVGPWRTPPWEERDLTLSYSPTTV